MTRPMVTVGIPFLAIALAVSFLNQEALLGVTIGLSAALLGTALFLRGKRRLTVCAVLGAALLACLNWMGYLNRSECRYTIPEDTRIRISGTVEDISPTSSGTRAAYTVWVDSHNIPDAPEEFRTILYAPAELDCDYYDCISAEAKSLPFISSGSFDGERYYRSQGVFIILSAYGTPEVQKNSFPPAGYYFKALNRELCRRVDAVLPAPDAGLSKAVFLGEDGDMDDVLYSWFQRAGITHIFVVSGLHVSLLAGIFFLLFGKLRVRPRLRAVLTAGMVWCFVALTGFRVPAVRAGIMMTVLLAGELFHRPADGLNSLCLAGMLLLLINPADIWNPSFLLTFTATSGAVVLAEPITKWMEQLFHSRGKLGHSIFSCLGLTFGCNLAMLPVILYQFRGISLAGPLVNLVAVPLLPVILILTGLLVLLYPVPILASACGKLLELLFGIIKSVSQFLAAPDWGYLGLNYSFVPLWLWGTLAILLIARLWKRDIRFIGRLTLVSLLLFAGIFGLERWIQRDTVEIVPVSSAGAEGVALLRGDSAVVLDLSDDGRLDGLMESLLRSKNIHRVDTLALGYPKTEELSDTAFLARTIPVGNLILSDGDPFYPYAERVLSLYGGVYPLREAHGFDLMAFGKGTLDLYRLPDGVLSTLVVGNTRIAITNSRAASENANCEILLTTEKNLDFPAKNSAKYVILLNKPRVSAISIRIQKDGRYWVRG